MVTAKTYGDDSQPIITTHEVLELTTTELDPALFEVPAGFTRIISKHKTAK